LIAACRVADFPEIVGARAHAGDIEPITHPGSFVMIDWDSEDWGGGVTYAADGSWLEDAHTNSEARADRER
jgi:hypothetical protein